MNCHGNNWTCENANGEEREKSSCDRAMLAQGYPIFTYDVYYTAFRAYYMFSFDSLSASSAFLPDTFCLASLSFAFNSSTVNSSYNFLPSSERSALVIVFSSTTSCVAPSSLISDLDCLLAAAVTPDHPGASPLLPVCHYLDTQGATSPTP